VDDTSGGPADHDGTIFGLQSDGPTVPLKSRERFARDHRGICYPNMQFVLALMNNDFSTYDFTLVLGMATILVVQIAPSGDNASAGYSAEFPLGVGHVQGV
jgi:hypothetical protein